MNRNLIDQIKEINRDNSLSNEEKNKKIQNLRNSCIRITNNKKCDHYEKKCFNFYFSCCNKYSNCHRCHEEEHKCLIKPPRKVKNIECKECGTRQEISNKCIKCGINFSNSFCSKCCIWTSKDITHCDKCGICRVGKEVFHCDKCNMCYNEKEHECTGTNFDSTCPFCLEDTFNSQKISTKLNNTCSHTFHVSCINDAFRNGIFNCPLCKKMLLDEENKKLYWKGIDDTIKMNPMPELTYSFVQIDEILGSIYGLIKVIDKNNIRIIGKIINWNNNSDNKVMIYINYADVWKTVNIYCNQCEIKSMHLKYHYYGNKCAKCNGYNTAIT